MEVFVKNTLPILWKGFINWLKLENRKMESKDAKSIHFSESHLFVQHLPFPQVKSVIKTRPLRLLTILNLTFAIMKMLMHLWPKAMEQWKESIFCWLNVLSVNQR